ncbi:MAG: NGG1p interacting factor NIF3 [Sphaerochaetaceae bacterium]|jgi:hypothetical protein
MYVFVTYVPESHLETVKQALFDAGCGKMDGYDKCCWVVKGEGQFRPLEGSNPFLGNVGKLEKVTEYRLEMVVDDLHVAQAVKALKKTHPYEVPAYHLVNVLTIGGPDAKNN